MPQAAQKRMKIKYPTVRSYLLTEKINRAAGISVPDGELACVKD